MDDDTFFCIMFAITIAIFIGCVSWVMFNHTAIHYETITVADTIDGYIKDTDGNVWRIWFDDPFDQRDLTIGSTVNIHWRGLKSGPDIGEYARFDGLVYRHPSATE